MQWKVAKSAAALLLESRIGERFDAVDVGDRIYVQLIGVDIEQGFIDFKRIGS